MDLESLHIVAPVSSEDEIKKVINAGADELYCGAMFDDWVSVFGDADLISRRQSKMSHINNPKTLSRVARLASDNGCNIALTLNVGYSLVQEQAVLDLVKLWEDVGGTSVLVSDLSLLLALQKRNSSLKRHLSILTGVFNSMSVKFFLQTGISRVVLPRHLSLNEVKALTKEEGKIEYEMLVMNQKCQFIDSMCGFYHGVHLPSEIPAQFDYEFVPGEQKYVSNFHDPDYEGHACQLEYKTDSGTVQHICIDDYHMPHCAACSLLDLLDADVRFLKIAGRGYPVDMITRSIRFISDSINIYKKTNGKDNIIYNIKELYSKTFGQPCKNKKCYYTLKEL